MRDEAEDANRQIELDKTEARQGARGLPVLYVLVAAVVLALIAWAIIEFVVR